ncbi:MAG: bifunctional rhamnulose-1-phosphate aldolase/short-chain dehydrogenase [Calditrichaeota bacterium]|nr:MAG: bifunctional rhamnulose-1-phosphate aldolase/short-chain dehydrogenase [Calditrichota bacterium]
MKFKYVTDLWEDSRASELSELDLLVYRSNLLGADLRITNFAGGNTSAKITEKDPLTREDVEVLWVKGSGGDLGSITREGFASLYLDKLQALKKLYRGLEYEDEMVAYLPHCTFNLNPRAASIDTPLHAFVPYKHVDHVHPDAIIAIAAAKNSQRLTQEIFGDRLGWLPWQRPGFDLALKIEKECQRNPQAVGLILGGHGLFTWADEAKACYYTTLQIIEEASEYIENKIARAGKVFGGIAIPALPRERRKDFAAQIMPFIRGQVSQFERKVGYFTDSEVVLQFVNSSEAKKLAEKGTSCPDHFLRTKIRPLLLNWDPQKDSLEHFKSLLTTELPRYRDAYASYYERCKHPDSPPMRDPNPVVFLVPGVGMITFAKDRQTARVSAEFYINAINVMRGASTISEYLGLPEQEAFNIEYWQLEEAKLRRMPPEKLMARKVVVITGGAGGIGKAIARKVLEQSGHVALLDRDQPVLEKATAALETQFGKDRVFGYVADVTQEAQMQEAFKEIALNYGGLDIVIPNAGIASSSAVEDTTLEEWRRNHEVLVTGYFLTVREGFRILKQQNLGGAMVFIVSKNALVAGKNASAYSSAKAAELHMARCLAEEGAPFGIRVNVVNPDAVLTGSRIWNESGWREQRAAAYGIKPEELEAFYRNRTALKVNVFPEDIAEAVLFFISDQSAKSTGNLLNVDGGVVAAFPR